jgi:kinesin family protein 11
LLSDKESKIIIREFSKTGFSLEGLESVEIGNEIAFKKELRRGLLKRSTKATKMNEVSSRSHTILTIVVETKKYDDEKGCLVRSSKLNFVDLAGS